MKYSQEEIQNQHPHYANQKPKENIIKIYHFTLFILFRVEKTTDHI